MNRKLFGLFLLTPTGLIFFWLSAYIGHVVDEGGTWWEFPFFMTLAIFTIFGVVVSIWSIGEITTHIKKEKEEA